MTTASRTDGGDGPILQVQDLAVHFPIRKGPLRRPVGQVKAVDGVTLELRRGETLGLVGESGCGKSTLARAILRLVEPTGGRVLYAGRDVLRMRRRELVAVRRRLQMVFQDPYASLNPRRTVGDIVAEPLRVHHVPGPHRRRVQELLELVGLDPDHAGRHPHAFSGGQRQRIAIARALAVTPDVVVFDEPVSTLDVSVQAQIVNLLQDLQRELGLSYLFIAHDLAVVKQISHRVAVMYLGRLVETGSRHEVFTRPAHPYTAALLSAVPLPDPDLERRREQVILPGEVPSPSAPPSGCTFHTRCPRARPECCRDVPRLETFATGGHRASCFFPVRPGQALAGVASRAGPGEHASAAG
ncbi:MAG: ATP-binding cassette domain-containing protein [Actinomycetota bacterium]|nr:ATP-binding cassette domain-containing protein [Actinomycetota bacterium]